MVTVFADQHLCQQSLGGHAAIDRTLWCWRLDDSPLASPTAITWPADHAHPQLSGDVVEHPALSSPIGCSPPPQQGQALSSTSTTTSTRGRCAGNAPRLRFNG